uniref:Phospholipid/glycerol acyltransferase domain-containing protein n=1 Tax=Oryza glumipatula TaxID=40148 RepID=A0A0D9ZFD1_9ORYZ
MSWKAFTKSLLFHSNKIVRRLKSFVLHAHPPPPPPPPPHVVRRPPSSDELPAAADVTVCKVEGGLLMSPSTFPYFMLVALEAGGLFRGLLLLLLYPVLLLLGHDRATKLMVMVSFAGVRKEKDGSPSFRVGRAVMPKLFLEDVSAEVFDAAARRRRRLVCVSSMPREMVEPFLKEYLAVDAVVAPELRAFRGYYLGLAESDGEVMQRLDMEEVIGMKECGGAGDGDGDGQEVYVASEWARRRWRPLHPRRYAKPLIFHDGRVAFRPTTSATLAMFVWLPLAVPLALLRVALIVVVLPFSLAAPIAAALGIHCRCIAASTLRAAAALDLFVCNHRSLLDPLYVSAVAGRADLAAATYSISRLSEILAPIRTFRLTRDRAADRAAMQAHLSRSRRGGLVVCPEGTTCREPFLLRFSPLFTELGADVQPVALHSEVAMFHGTTAGGCKILDPFFLLMNPSPAYVVHFLDPVAGGGGGPEVANEVQRRIAETLGYTCTALTRRDKYLVLAGNDGVVANNKSN